MPDSLRSSFGDAALFKQSGEVDKADHVPVARDKFVQNNALSLP